MGTKEFQTVWVDAAELGSSISWCWTARAVSLENSSRRSGRKALPGNPVALADTQRALSFPSGFRAGLLCSRGSGTPARVWSIVFVLPGRLQRLAGAGMTRVLFNSYCWERNGTFNDGHRVPRPGCDTAAFAGAPVQHWDALGAFLKQ